MAAYKPLMIEKNETDIKKIMRQLYRFSEDLKFTISNISLDDNVSKETLDAITDRGNTVRKIKFDTEHFVIEYENYKIGVVTRLDQTEDTISFLVDSGNVVKEMLTRMELHGEYIRFTSGQILINAQNMTLDAVGNAVFSGAINGGSININNRFIVHPNGDCYVDDSLKTETLNPAQGVTAADMEVYNDNDYINTIGRTATCGEAYISETLSCNRVRYTSDRRKKREIRPLTDVSVTSGQYVTVSMAGILLDILPRKCGIVLCQILTHFIWIVFWLLDRLGSIWKCHMQFTQRFTPWPYSSIRNGWTG